jgi:hypothetical protein
VLERPAKLGARCHAAGGWWFFRGFELIALYQIHYLKDRAGWTDGLFINSRGLGRLTVDNVRGLHLFRRNKLAKAIDGYYPMMSPVAGVRIFSIAWGLERR